jgi:hypothetical protein
MNDIIELLKDARPPADGPSPEIIEDARASLVDRRPRGRRRRVLWAAPALAAGVAAVVLGITLTDGDGDRANASQSEKIADAAPRLLLDLPGWKVARTDRFSVEYGQVTLTNGTQELELQWLPEDEYQLETEKRVADLENLGTAPAGESEARLFRYPGTDEYVAVWLRGDYTVEARGRAPDIETFKTTIAALHEVDIAAWLTALPRASKYFLGPGPPATRIRPKVPPVAEMSVFKRARTPADVLPEQLRYLLEPFPCPDELRDLGRCPYPTAIGGESRLLLSDLGIRRESMYGWPTDDGGVCLAKGDGGAVCMRQWLGRIRAEYNGSDPPEIHGRGAPGAIMGLVPDDVVAVDVVVLGMRRPATLGNNAYFYELPDVSCGMSTFDALVVTLRDGTVQSVPVMFEDGPQHEGKVPPAFCRG